MKNKGDSNYFSQAGLCYLLSNSFQPKSGRCYCAASTSCAIISYDSSDCLFLTDTYPERVRNSAITSGICLLVSAFLLALSFYEWYCKGVSSGGSNVEQGGRELVPGKEVELPQEQKKQTDGLTTVVFDVEGNRTPTKLF